MGGVMAHIDTTPNSLSPSFVGGEGEKMVRCVKGVLPKWQGRAFEPADCEVFQLRRPKLII